MEEMTRELHGVLNPRGNLKPFRHTVRNRVPVLYTNSSRFKKTG